ncbi:MAG: hypothetical protein ABSA85_05760 [Terracidiphilus sp.]|jgi:hypothetical protein
MSMGADTTSPDGRWGIVWVVIKDFNAYFESDTTYEVRVWNTATGEVLTTFIRGEFENSEGATNSGVRAVEFTADSSSVVATYENGRTETVDLPPPENDISSIASGEAS